MNSLPCCKNICVTFLLLIISISAVAQADTIRGTVKTSDSHPVPAVTVALSGTAKGTLTNEQGRYQLNKVKAGKYILKLSSIGLTGQKRAITVIAGETLTVDLILDQDAQQLADVVVSANRRLKFGDKQSETVARMPLANLENPQVYSVITSDLLREQNIVDYKTAMRNAAGTSPSRLFNMRATLKWKARTISATMLFCSY